MEIQEGNKLIAEFMEYETCSSPEHANDRCYKVPYAKGYHKANQLQHHSSWDWLMPVVEKIFEYSLAYPEQSQWVCSAKIVVDIIPCWENVVKFIQWYNTRNE